MPITPLAEQHLAAFTAGGADFPGGSSHLDALKQCGFYVGKTIERVAALR